MKFTSITLSMVGAFFTTGTLATIGYGTQGQFNVAWIDGEDPCTTDKDISKTSVNPCGIRFTLDNGFTYFLQNCGDSQFALYNNDGSFNHIASFNKATYNCDGNIDTVFRSWLF